MAVSFLTTIVKNPDEYYWGELSIVLKYLKVTDRIKLMLIVDSVLSVN